MRVCSPSRPSCVRRLMATGGECARYGSSRPVAPMATDGHSTHAPHALATWSLIWTSFTTSPHRPLRPLQPSLTLSTPLRPLQPSPTCHAPCNLLHSPGFFLPTDNPSAIRRLLVCSYVDCTPLSLFSDVHTNDMEIDSAGVLCAAPRCPLAAALSCSHTLPPRCLPAPPHAACPLVRLLPITHTAYLRLMMARQPPRALPPPPVIIRV